MKLVDLYGPLFLDFHGFFTHVDKGEMVMTLLCTAITVIVLLRFFFMTRAGWYESGNHLTSGGNVWMAMV